MEATLPARVTELEWKVRQVEPQVAEHDDAIQSLQQGAVGTDKRQAGVEKAVDRLQSSVDKVYWAIIGLSITIATSAIGLALQQVLSKGDTP